MTYAAVSSGLLWSPISVNTWGGRIARALSLRVIFFSFLGGIGIGVLAGLAWPSATMPVVWITTAALYLVAVFNDGQMIHCPACRKRVKLGAQRCHHCGYQQT